MNILIAGAGKVGYNIAKALSENHNVIIIDKNEKALNSIKESLDVMTIIGDMKETRTFLNITDKIDFYIVV
jgi:trk system potassium uptake protein TrkA